MCSTWPAALYDCCCCNPKNIRKQNRAIKAPVLAWAAIAILKGRYAVAWKQREKTIQKNMIRYCGCLGPESVRARQPVEENMMITLSWAT